MKFQTPTDEKQTFFFEVPSNLSQKEVQEAITKEAELSEAQRLDDPRITSNASVKVADSTLGQAAEVLDAVLRPPFFRPKSTLEVFADFLETTPKNIVVISKAYAPFKSKLIRYALPKVFNKDSGYQKTDIVYQLDDDIVVSLTKGGNEMEVIPIGPGKTTKIPVSFLTGIVKGQGKMVLQTKSDWGGFYLICYCKKGDEDFVDGFTEYLENWVKENNFYKGAKIDPKGNFLKLNDYTWNDVFLSPNVKKAITNNILDFFKKEPIYIKNGIPSKRGILFEGPPGTGKSLSGKVLASKGLPAATTFIWVTPDDLRCSEDVSQIFDLARELNPTVLFIEDADLFCVDRGYDRKNPILGEIMNNMDGLVELHGVVTIMTSNNPDIMEKALVDRPGRFDVRILFAPPSEDLIEKMLKTFFGKVKTKFNFSDAAVRISGHELTGAHIKEIANLSTIYAIDDNSLDTNDIAIVTDEHVNKAIDSALNLKIRAGVNAVSKTTAGKGPKNGPVAAEMPDMPKYVESFQKELQQALECSPQKTEEKTETSKPKGFITAEALKQKTEKIEDNLNEQTIDNNSGEQLSCGIKLFLKKLGSNKEDDKNE